MSKKWGLNFPSTIIGLKQHNLNHTKEIVLPLMNEKYPHWPRQGDRAEVLFALISGTVGTIAPKVFEQIK